MKNDLDTGLDCHALAQHKLAFTDNFYVFMNQFIPPVGSLAGSPPKALTVPIGYLEGLRGSCELLFSVF